MRINKVSMFWTPGTSTSINRSTMLWLLVGGMVAIKAAIIYWLVFAPHCHCHKKTALVKAQTCHTAATCLAQCELHGGASCNQLVNLHEMRMVNESSRTIAVYRKACLAGNQLGCDAVGDVYRDGTGITQDFKTASIVYTKACEGGEGWSCSSLGYLYQNGSGVLADPNEANRLFAHARKLLEPACAAHNAIECDALANLYQYGSGGPQDSAKAVALFQESCHAGNLEACDNLGIMFFFGQADASSNSTGLQKVQASKLFQMACDGGHSWGCKHLHYVNYLAQQEANQNSSPPPVHRCGYRSAATYK